MKRKRLREIIRIIDEEISMMGGWVTPSRDFLKAMDDLRSLAGPEYKPPPPDPTPVTPAERHDNLYLHRRYKV